MSQVLLVPSLPVYGNISMARYALELKLAFESVAPPDFSFDALGTIGEDLPVRGHITQRFINKWIMLPSRLRFSRNYSIVHLLDHFLADGLDFISRRSQKVITLHDIAPLLTPGGLSPSQNARFRRTVAQLHKADIVVSISKATAESIIDYAGLEVDQLRIVPNGVNTVFFEHQREMPEILCGTRERFVVLSIGTTDARKNLDLLPEVFQHCWDNDLQCVLVRIGSKLPADLEGSLRNVLGPKGFIDAGKVSNDTVAAVYQHCDALIFPSLVEGYGLPVLEALAAGCEVACSDIPALREAGGELPFFFDPRDPAHAADSLKKIAALSDEEKRKRREVTRAYVHKHSWENTAQKLLDVYRECIG